MRESGKILIGVMVLGIAIPSLLFSWVPDKNESFQERPITSVTAAPEAETADGDAEPILLSVLSSSGAVAKIELDEYLTGVVLREMPADFEYEALKAQAVVARTYTLRRHQKGSKHDQADICTDSSCCQGYRDSEEYLSAGGTQADVEKISKAVKDTKDLVLTYDGELIEATYFSCSGGQTEDAKAVWGSDVPYLQSIESPGEEHAAHYTDTVTFSKENFLRLLGCNAPASSADWIGPITYTEGGGIDTIRICGVTYSGTQLRQRLGLRSTAFVITVLGNTVTVTTKGFGHRVGMSQYGADAMAVQGSSFSEILTHYYQGVTLTQYKS